MTVHKRTPAVRVMVEALTRKPVEVVQEVGVLMVLCASVVETTSSTTDGGAAVKENAALTVTSEDRQRAIKLVGRAKRLNMVLRQGGSTRGEGPLGLLTEGELRSWAVIRKRNIPRLQQLLGAFKSSQPSHAKVVRNIASSIIVANASKVKKVLLS